MCLFCKLERQPSLAALCAVTDSVVVVHLCVCVCVCIRTHMRTCVGGYVLLAHVCDDNLSLS